MTKRTFVLSTLVLAAGALLLLAPAARALDLGGLAGKAAGAAGNSARDKAVKDVNAKLLAEGRKSCSIPWSR